MRKNGETNPVTYLLVVLIAAALFYAFHVGPVYWDNLTVKEAAQEAVNVYILNGEDAAKAGMLSRLNVKSPETSHFEVDADGVESEKPGFGLTEDNVTFTLDEHTKKLTLRVEYDRTIQFKPLKKRKTYHLMIEKVGITR